MPINDPQHTIDFTVNRDNLYREESFTDIKVAAIRRLIPVKPDGSDDESRDPLFMAQTQLMSPSGPVLLQTILDAGNLEQAMDRFPVAMQKELDRVMAEEKKKE
ncbi:MAG: cytoplasmic protein [Desulfobacterales bacterium]